MSESTPANVDKKATQINLAEVVSRYLEGLQRVHDVINYVLAGERLLNEQEYENFSRASRVMPSQATRMDYDKAKEETNNWLLKQTLNETLGLLTLYLDDCRTICSICQWKADSGRTDGQLQKILNEDRATFLRLDLPAKIDALGSQYGISSTTADHVKSLYKARLSLSNANGLVSDKEAVDGKLAVTLRNVQLVSKPAEGQGGGVFVTSEVGDISKSFAVGDKVKLAKSEHLACILTIAFYVTTLAQSLRDYAQKLGVTQ
jgi:hypothetical protein